MLHIIFEYKDNYTGSEWHRHECWMSSLEEAKRVYRLGIDCEYRIIAVIKVK